MCADFHELQFPQAGKENQSGYQDRVYDENVVRRPGGYGRGGLLFCKIYVHHRKLCRHAHSLGKEVCAWTLNYQGDMQRMVNCGVDNIITDDPELVRKVILGTTDRNPGFVSLLGYALK